MNKGEKRNGAAFYIALCCCVAVIGAVGYAGRYAARTATDEPVENASAEIVPASTPIMLLPPEKTAEPAPTIAAAAQGEAKQTAAVIKDKTPVREAEKKSEKAPEEPLFDAPCAGGVIKEISGDELEYNAILGDWRTHNGVDVSLASGGEVNAVHSGVVEEVYSGALGETVIVNCQNGFKAVYACLAENDALVVGSEIKKGDIIGNAGATGSETVSEPHLHFELIKDGEYVNPRDYIKFGE